VSNSSSSQVSFEIKKSDKITWTVLRLLNAAVGSMFQIAETATVKTCTLQLVQFLQLVVKCWTNYWSTNNK